MTTEMFAYDWVLDESPEETLIRIYGITEDNKNICLRVEDFLPYAYIHLPDSIEGCSSELITTTVMNALKYDLTNSPLNIQLVKKYHLYNTENKKSSEDVTQNKKSKFLFVNFKSKKHISEMTWFFTRRGIKINGKTVNINVHEVQASPILQMVSLKDIPMSGWIDFSYKKPEPVPEDEKVTVCDEEYIIKWKRLQKSEKIDQVVPKCMAFDLEVNSTYMNQMPSDKPGDAIFQISCIFTEKDKEKRNVLLTLEAKDMDLTQSELLEGTKVLVYKTEKDLLWGFINLILDEKPNVITGYNIFGFDIEYTIKRMQRFFLLDEFKLIGFNRTSPSMIREIRWSSSAYKNQEFKYIDWEGILLLDLLPIIKRDYKLDTYSLKNVTSKFLNNNTKDPVTAKDIFTAYRTREKMDIVGKYCIQDSDLCLELMKYMHSWVALSEMAKVCNVSMFTLYTKGQQIKIYSQVYKYCLNNNIVVNTNGYEAKMNERYRGAHVIEPIPGFYQNVVPLDFSSLYPSLIIAWNICYSTIVTDKSVPDKYCNVFEWEDHVGCEHDPKEIKIKQLSKKIDDISEELKVLRKKRDAIKVSTVGPGKNVKTEKAKIQEIIDEKVKSQKPYREERSELKKTNIGEYEDDEGNKFSKAMCAKRYYRFIKPEIRKGVIPTIIQSLLDSRKRVKKLMKSAEGGQKIVYDKEQLAYKVSANSMYGAMGVRKGFLPFMPGAMCVTYSGRTALENTSRLIQQHFKGKLVYGDTDSNYVTFPHLDNVTDIWNYALEVAEKVTNWEENGKRVFPRPINLEFENVVYNKFLILSKKRYMYQSADKDGNFTKKVGKKGVVLARRDNAQIVRKVYENVTMMIFDGKTKSEIRDYLEDSILKIYRNEFEYSDYVITKSVGDSKGEVDENNRMGDYKIKALPDDPEERKKVLNGRSEKEYFISCCPAQVQLAEKMKRRGVPVDAGSRLEFVVTRNPGKVKLSDKIEDYEYFLKFSHLLDIDAQYYVDAMINPLDQIFKTMGFGPMTKELSLKWDEIYKKEKVENAPIFEYEKKKTEIKRRK
ncbi:042L [Cherax quadricarinatus iridovirus]|uniref:DNA-directed DNA polymerase n=1 Tax=Shrimp hemocyte iridescent virus TaxID=2039780 RepID=A0A291B0U9_9VIRU|nr:042L [Cherax quadricarinatus iridovirus]YP_010084862.1 DNA polymerase [Shrimp hemocyte iridescent virus]UPA43360.1 DNA polymerase [Iridovirus CN01]ASZ85022.1 042L [Cherax quadricarinatus iridovirus]ATE87119.1 DNA polymerase [Shrimp hemocyte iridescent virus]UPA43436.1 DNA polymerase [Iridovirus CN01]UPA43630.1 DNA polymerase [Iridovirus CN01]